MNKLILDFINTGVEPYPDVSNGVGFRCSAYLTDGTYLPCVMLRESRSITDLALRRFEEEKKGRGIFGAGNHYRDIVKSFVASGNKVSDFDLKKIELSKYAIPLSLLKKIEGETSMAWTGFVLEMRDGNPIPFGTSFIMEFFDIPDNYTFDDVVAVHNHSYVSKNGEIKSLKQGMSIQSSDYDRSQAYREKPYFDCYYDR
jgi:hypothetical protein